MPLMTPEDQIRFWCKVDRKSKEECWLWTDRPHMGYGQIRCQNKITVQVELLTTYTMVKIQAYYWLVIHAIIRIALIRITCT